MNEQGRWANQAYDGEVAEADEADLVGKSNMVNEAGEASLAEANESLANGGIAVAIKYSSKLLLSIQSPSQNMAKSLPKWRDILEWISTAFRALGSRCINQLIFNKGTFQNVVFSLRIQDYELDKQPEVFVGFSERWK